MISREHVEGFTQTRWPATFTGRCGPRGTGDFYTGVHPGAAGEADRTTWPSGHQSWSFRVPGGAWLGCGRADVTLAVPVPVRLAIARLACQWLRRAAADAIDGTVRCPYCGALGEPVYAGHGDGLPYATGEFYCARGGVQIRSPRPGETARWAPGRAA